MDSLYIVEQGCYLRKDGDSLKIMKGKKVVQTIPATGLKRLVISGWNSLTGAVLDFLIRNQVDTVFMTPTGRFRARLLLDDTGHVELRQKQYVRLSDNTFKVQTAKAVVAGKLENHIRLLRRRAVQRNIPELASVALQIRALSRQLEKEDDLERIRGLEGYGARLLYGVLGTLISNDRFVFSGRNRRPPRDPVNALLSFVYTLFTNEVQNALKVAGLDPYLGALHEPGRGRPSLACDLVEEWRAWAERMVLTLINRKVLVPEDFVFRKALKSGDRPVEMKPAVSRALIAAYEKQMEHRVFYPAVDEVTSIRMIIHGQARLFARSLNDGAEIYRPFLMPY